MVKEIGKEPREQKEKRGERGRGRETLDKRFKNRDQG